RPEAAACLPAGAQRGASGDQEARHRRRAGRAATAARSEGRGLGDDHSHPAARQAERAGRRAALRLAGPVLPLAARWWKDVPVTSEFARSPRSSVGIEWELALVDVDSGDLRQVAQTVLDAVAPPDGGQHPSIRQELLLNTVEVVSGARTTVPAAMDDLAAAADMGRG